MNLKGQITLFVILGFVLVVAAAFILYVKSPERPPALELPMEMQAAKTFVESCLQQTAVAGIYEIGMQGGYYDVPSPFCMSSGYKTPYYDYLGSQGVPELGVIEQQLSKFVDERLSSCLEDFQSFHELGYEFETGALVSHVSFSASETLVELQYPIRIRKGEATWTLQSFQEKLTFRFQEKYQLSKEIMDAQRANANSVPLGYLTSLSYDHGFTYELSYLGDGSVIYCLVFNESAQQNPFVYCFAVKYDWNLSQKKTVSIGPIPEILITDETQRIEYQVKALGQNLTFYDDTDLFDIDRKTGVVRIVASELTNGRRTVLIRAVDSYGNEDYAVMSIRVNMSSRLPVIQPIPNQTAVVGQEFEYRVKASDPTNSFVTFVDDTSLFDIHPITGEIRFLPSLGGNYTIKIVAANEAGHSYEYLHLRVK
jgi:hypothetical protein